MAKFKIINSDQGHNYTHYVEAPDKQIAMDRFKAGHYGSIIDCEEIVSLSSTPDPVEPTAKEETFKKHFDKFRHGAFRASLDHYLETGTVSGSLLLAVREMLTPDQNK